VERKKSCTQSFGEKHEGKIPSGRCRCSWDDDKIDIKYDMTVRNDLFEMEQGLRVGLL
jgi:hypothetical protein